MFEVAFGMGRTNSRLCRRVRHGSRAVLAWDGFLQLVSRKPLKPEMSLWKWRAAAARSSRQVEAQAVAFGFPGEDGF